MVTKVSRYFIAFFLLCVVVSCATPRSASYNQFYSHLNRKFTPTPFLESDYFLIIFVDAPHLDYSNNYSLLKTIGKHPSNHSKNRDVGHVWIHLQGFLDGHKVYVTGGMSGERGFQQAKYFDGIMNYIDFGYANPTEEHYLCPRKEANPIKYLWETQYDGFFQWGDGGHRPSFAAKIDLDAKQFHEIWSFVQHYPYREYALVGNQCSSFVVQVASLAGLELTSEVTITFRPQLKLNGEIIPLWSDPCYSRITIATPDVIEKSLMQAVAEGRAQYVKDEG